MKNSSAQQIDSFSSGNIVKILDFFITSLHGEQYRLGINIQKIKEIVECENLQALPNSYKPFMGIYNLRDTPVPIIYLGAFLDTKDTTDIKFPTLAEVNKTKRILICEFQKIHLGFIIDKTGKIFTVKNSDLHSVPGAIDGVNGNLYNGITKVNDEFINLLNIEYILDSLKIDLGYDKFPKGKSTFKNKSVLLVEDSKLFQKKIQQFFESMGLNVVVANDGLEGLARLTENKFAFDLIFTDIEMPNLNGIGMIRQIKKIPEAQKIPVFFNTSISNEGLIQDIKNEELGTYFVKYDEETLYHAIKTIFE